MKRLVATVSQNLQYIFLVLLPTQPAASAHSATCVRATAEQLSRDLAGDPKHIYKHKIRQESAPSRGS